MRTIRDLIIHCTATKEGQDIGFKEIDAWHKQKGWSGCGYHYIVRLNGNVEVGRPEEKVGAHVRGFNRNSIGITYVGGVDSINRPKDTRTSAQIEALKCLLENLKCSYPDAKISGHRDFSPDLNKDGIIQPFEWTKVCPCFDARKEYKDL